ncbi:MAG: hypothetical protein RSB36_00485 [Hydrogenoanaerobacterium sp.]
MIDRAEILKHLGYEGKSLVGDKLNLACNEAIKTIKEASSPAFLCSYFDIDKKSDGVLLCGTKLLLKGASISRHLEHCGKIAVFCVSLLNEVDKIIMRAKFDVLQQLFLDVAASVYIEQICERICQMIKCENENFFMTKRYGIGYGDLSLSYQQDILTILDAQKRIGVTATDDGILIPRKSVTAIVGFSSTEAESSYQTCDSCLLRGDCKYFMRGEHCGK